MPASRPYTGPVGIPTNAELQAALPYLVGKPECASLVAKIHAALGSDPAWRTPTR